MKYNNEQIYNTIRQGSKLYVFEKNYIDRSNQIELEKCLQSLPVVFPINYEELKEKNPTEYVRLFDEATQTPSTDGFIEELQILVNNNGSDVDPTQKIIKGTFQYQAYQEMLNGLNEEGSISQSPEHRYATPYNSIMRYNLLLADEQIDIVKDLLQEVIESAIVLPVEVYVDDMYAHSSNELDN